MEIHHERLSDTREADAMPDYATIWLAVLVAIVAVSIAALLLGQQAASSPHYGDAYEAGIGVTQDTPALNE